jgi:hypothetical protein
MIQRFSLLVWPDQSPTWRDCDEYPNSTKRAAAYATFDYLDKLVPEGVGAECDNFGKVPCLRFDTESQGIFKEWRADLEKRLRSPDIHPALEGHLAKYRKLVPSLALINHLASGGIGAVSKDATERAIRFSAYLETHARRAYGCGITAEADFAKAILARIRNGDLQDGFTAREVSRNRCLT